MFIFVRIDVSDALMCGEAGSEWAVWSVGKVDKLQAMSSRGEGVSGRGWYQCESELSRAKRVDEKVDMCECVLFL